MYLKQNFEENETMSLLLIQECLAAPKRKNQMKTS